MNFMENDTLAKELKKLEDKCNLILSNLNLQLCSKIRISPINELSKNECDIRIYYEKFCDNFNQLKLSETHSKNISQETKNMLCADAHKALNQLEFTINKTLEKNK